MADWVIRPRPRERWAICKRHSGHARRTFDSYAQATEYLASLTPPQPPPPPALASGERFAKERFTECCPAQWVGHIEENWRKPKTQRRWIAGCRGGYLWRVLPVGVFSYAGNMHPTTAARARKQTALAAARQRSIDAGMTKVATCRRCGTWHPTDDLHGALFAAPFGLLERPTADRLRAEARSPCCAHCRTDLQSVADALRGLKPAIEAKRLLSREIRKRSSHANDHHRHPERSDRGLQRPQERHPGG